VTTRREALIGLAAGALALPRPSLGQPRPAKLARLGYLAAESAPDSAERVEAFRAGLSELGYVEGRDIHIEWRWADGDYERLPALAGELVRLKVDVLVTAGTKATLGAKKATTTVPIVMASSGDIVALGLVASLASPGGNITGSTNVGRELGPKRLGLLKEALPRITRVAYLVNPSNPAFGPNLQAMSTTARTLKVDLRPREIRRPAELAGALSEMAAERVAGFVLQDDTAFAARAREIAALAEANSLSSAGNRPYAEAGGLIGYGPNIRELDRRAAYFVDKILKGAKPANLPIEQPTKFELIVNATTAAALGVRISDSLLLRATKVVQGRG
jgi:putative ABC transport system substrate-binding protein